MERENSQNRKRTRDEDDDHRSETRKDKKQETINFVDNESLYDGKGYEFCDGIGVFDFPWLKEGVIFKTDEYLDKEDTFATCSCLEEVSSNFADESCVEDSFIPPFIDQKKLDDDSFFTLQVDDLEPVDRIWSSVLDEPLDIGLNKG